MEIKNLSQVSVVSGATNVPVYDTASGRTRVATLDVISQYLAGTIKPTGGSLSNGNLTLIFGDGSSLVINNVKSTGLGDMPTTLNAGQFLRVNPLGTGYELVAQPAVGTQITVKNNGVTAGFADTVNVTGNASFSAPSGGQTTLNVNAVKVATGVDADDLLKFDIASNQLVATGAKVAPDGSITVPPTSLYFGGAHRISSAGENVTFTNMFNPGWYAPVWQSISALSSSYPVWRNYTDLGPTDLVVESSTADILTNPVYVLTATANRRLFSATVLAASSQTNVVFELICNGVTVWKKNVGSLTTGQYKVIDFTTMASPIDIKSGQIFTTNVTSSDGAVTLRGNAANQHPYLSLNQRVWADVMVGDMLKSVYDPQNINADSFARANQTGQQAISTVAGLQTALDSKADAAATTTALAGKVDVVAGKQLSTNDYTTAEKNKLAGITAGADMLRSIYDTNNDGIVDNAAKVNGVDAAGNRMYYGTNASGAPGFFSLNFRSVSNVGSAGRPFNSAFTVSATRDAIVFYTINAAISSSTTTASNSRVDIQVAGSTVDSIESSVSVNATVGTTTVSIVQKRIISAYVPAGSTVQLVTSGTVTPTLLSGQEVLL